MDLLEGKFGKDWLALWAWKDDKVADSFQDPSLWSFRGRSVAHPIRPISQAGEAGARPATTNCFEMDSEQALERVVNKGHCSFS